VTQTAADLARPVEPLRSILIVDEDADTRTLYRTLFTGVVGTIIEAEDGAEALGKAVCRQPDVILTETRLRRIDGYTLCTYLRRERLTRSAAIVVVTGASRPAEIARAGGAGADEVLVKPFLPDALLAAVFRSWRRRRGVETGPAARIQ
jgi:two-component system phosphate regulon response regulator PhoB